MKIRKYAIKYTAVFVLYILIIVSFSAPLSENIHSRILGGESTDLNGSLWYQWFTKKCVLSADFLSLNHTDFIAYPSGKNLIFDLGFPLLAIISIPFQAVMNFPSYYNIFILLLMAVNGFACFALIYYLYKDMISAFIGGLIFLLNPYVLYQVNSGRPEQAALFWIPLFILLLLKIKEEKKKIYSVIGALFLVLTSLSYWYYGIFLLILTVIFILYHSFLKKDGYFCFLKNVALLLCLYFTGIFLLFFYPVLVLGIYPAGYELIKPFPAFSDIVANKTPAYFNYMINFNAANCLPPWFIAIIAAIILFSILNIKSLRTNLFYTITAGFFFILSLGPYLKISDHAAIALPYIFLYYVVPFFQRLWWPVNCFSITLICASILAAGLISSMRSKTNRLTKILFPATLIIIYLFPYYNGQHNTSGYLSHLKTRAFSFSDTNKPHEVYNYLKTQPDCAIIELPFNKVRLDFFQNQIIHGKKVFECPGYAIKEIVWPKKHLQFLHSNTFLRYLDTLFSDAPAHQEAPSDQALKNGLKKLYDINIKFIVINPQYFSHNEAENQSIEKLKNILKKPYKEYPDRTLLYKIEDLIHD